MEHRIKPSILKYIAVVTIGFFLSQCDTTSTNKTETGEEKSLPKEIVTPAFNADSAFLFIAQQVDFGPRTPNSKAHENCAKWLVQKLKSYDWKVIEQKGEQVAHDGTTLNFTNIFASYRAELKKRILLTAHWDTRPWADSDPDQSFHQKPIDGANDGGSGVAVLLEIARLLQNDTLPIGVDILLFDIEDYGISAIENSFCYGSQYWSKNPTYQDQLPQYGINLDMVGDPKATYFYEGHSNTYARHVLDKVWASAYALGYQKQFIREVSYPVTDDHFFVNQAGIPCIDLIHRDPNTGRFPDSWHTHRDGLENISKTSLEMMGKVLLRVIYSEK